jgi:hypothetical protein
MPSNSEMYDRGALDAEHDELNPFYYQHYYYYRRGYDDARRQIRRGPGARRAPLLIAMAAAAVIAFAAGFWLFGRPTPGAALAPTAQPAALATARPTARPTATPRPTVTATVAPTLAVGGRARLVNLNGSPLRAREAPGLAAAIVGRIPEGSEVAIGEGPVEADGYTWWRVEAEGVAGWVAASSPEGVSFLEVIP